MSRLRTVLMALVLSAILPQLSGAQSLTEQFRSLYSFGSCGEPVCLDVNPTVHGNHFVPSVSQGQENMLSFIEQAIASGVSSVPLPSATSGVFFSFMGGAPTADTVSPGPIFGERAQTLGQGRLLFGLNASSISMSDIRGTPLENLYYRFPHEDVAGDGLGNIAFENDLIEVNTSLKVDVVVASLSASYGLTDRLDLGVAVPLIHTSLSGNSLASINNDVSQSNVHAFLVDGVPSTFAEASASGSATGIGDVGARLKFRATDQGPVALGVVGEVRLPTGSKDDFLGTGSTSFRALGIASGTYGRFSPHVNAGVLLQGEAALRDYMVSALGFDYLALPNLTLAGEFLANLSFGSGGITLPRTQEYFDGRTETLTNIPDGSDNLMDVAFGFKFHPTPDFRFLANVLVPVNDGGMRPTALWTVGLEVAR